MEKKGEGKREKETVKERENKCTEIEILKDLQRKTRMEIK